MLWVSTISVFGFFGSTFPNSLRAIPGLRSLVSLESITNCWTFPCGTPLTALRSGAGTYSGPITKLPPASSGGFSPVFSTLKGGEPGASNLRTGGAADKQGQARTVIKRAVCGLTMIPPPLRVSDVMRTGPCSAQHFLDNPDGLCDNPVQRSLAQRL